MPQKTLTKEERAAKRAARQQTRTNIISLLAALKGKDIKKSMTAKEKEDLLVVISDFLGIYQNGIIL